MTYTVRCRHGELFATCRECPEWTGWPDPLYVSEDEPVRAGNPLTVSEPRGFAAGCAFLLLVAAVAGLAGYLLGVTR